MHQARPKQDLALFLEHQDPPCLSLYQTTHRRYPENQQDPIRFKNLLKVLEESLLRQYSTSETGELLDPFRALLEDKLFWNHTWDGLAVLASAGLFRTFKFQRPVLELAVVADSFHIKPLLRILQSDDRYQVLSLNRAEIKLFEGTRDNLDEIELAPGVPRTITQALGEELTEPHQTVASYGGTGLGSNMRHGQGSKQDEKDIDEERFFRAVDRAILEHHSRPSGLPLMLAALTQYHSLFHQISHNPFLMADGIEVDAAALTIDQLRQRAWSVMEPKVRSRVSKLANEFQQARSKDLGSDDVSTVAHAAAESRVGSLLVEAQRHISGQLDQGTGCITFGAVGSPQTDDVLDDLAELVLKKGGHVTVAPAADMPTTHGLAATFRF
ncbi:MAG: hypothetical protein M3Z32_04900 [Acidobacteriota bacterium]|nr:hypothetical protein [Acidobacteriota bacterium]